MNAQPKPADLIPELLKEWAEIAARILVDDAGLSRNESADLGQKIALAIAEECAGSNLYIPVAYAHKIAARDRQIYDAYNGRNRDEVCQRFGITVHTFYRAKRRVEAVDGPSRNLPLFPSD